jgi:hypothetical protein
MEEVKSIGLRVSITLDNETVPNYFKDSEFDDQLLGTETEDIGKDFSRKRSNLIEFWLFCVLIIFGTFG